MEKRSFGFLPTCLHTGWQVHLPCCWGFPTSLGSQPDWRAAETSSLTDWTVTRFLAYLSGESHCCSTQTTDVSHFNETLTIPLCSFYQVWYLTNTLSASVFYVTIFTSPYRNTTRHSKPGMMSSKSLLTFWNCSFFHCMSCLHFAFIVHTEAECVGTYTCPSQLSRKLKKEDCLSHSVSNLPG